MKRSDLDAETGNRLRLCRQLSGLSIEDVATRVCMVKSRYKQLESSFSKSQQDLHLESLARVLGVEPEWIASGKGVAPHGAPQSVERRPLTPQERHARNKANELLGQRARLRRIQLGVSAVEAACFLRITRDTFTRWEESLGNVRGIAHESNWERLLKVPKGWLRNEAIAATPAHSNAFRRLAA